MTNVIYPNQFSTNNSESIKHKLLRSSVMLFVITSMIVVNGYSWLMTSNGLLVSGFVPPDNIFLNGETMMRIVILIMQFCIVGFYLVLPRVSSAWLFSTPIIILGLGVVLASAFLSLVSVSNQGMGQQLLANRRSDIRTIANQLQSADHFITQSFQSKLESLDMLAQRASRGLDHTGIAHCGSHCKSLIREVNQIRRDYSVLAVPAYQQTIEVDDWPAVQAAYAQLQPRLNQFQQFAGQYSLTVPPSLGGLQNSMRSINQSITEIGSNPFHLTIQWLGNISQKRRDTRFWLGLGNALLPDILCIMLTCMLSFVQHYDMERIEIQRRIKRNRLLAKLYRQKRQANEAKNRSKLEDTYSEQLWDAMP